MNRFTSQMRLFPLLAAAMLFGGQLASAVDISVGGSLRPRVEFVDEGAQGQAVGQSKTHTTMQTRINVKATVDDDVSAFVQVQDVRTWGGEPGSAGIPAPFGGGGPAGAPPSITRTGTSTSGQLDLHQAYFVVKNALDSGVGLKIGRQEMVFDEARLIGNIGWIQQAQSFDAARLDFSLAALNITAFYSETVSKDTHPTLAATVSGATIESRFYGVRATHSLGGKDRITPYFYYSENPNGIFVPTLAPGGAGTTPGSMQSLATAGVYFLKHFGDFRFRFDGAYQFGDESPTVDIAAYMLTAALSTNLDMAEGANFMLWADYMSGDDGLDSTRNNFTTPYATNHAYYGHIDKFLNIPAWGLIDLAAKFWVKPTTKSKFVAHFHYFRSAENFGPNNDSDLGSEIDLQFHYPLATNTKLVLGYSRYFGTGTVNGAVTGNSTLDSNWAFAMMAMKF